MRDVESNDSDTNVESDMGQQEADQDKQSERFQYFQEQRQGRREMKRFKRDRLRRGRNDED